jgi:hypothetical protein
MVKKIFYNNAKWSTVIEIYMTSAPTFILAFAVVVIFNSTVLANISYAQLFQPLPPSSSPSVQSLVPSKNAGLQLTPEQKAAMCDPNDSSVNTTESHICGIPRTLPTLPTGANATTRAEAPRSSPATTPTLP